MGIFIALDYGEKRTGIAVTDINKIIASGLTALSTKEVIPYLIKYCEKNFVEKLIIGHPKKYNNSESQLETKIKYFIKKLNLSLPKIPIVRHDERFTSKIASNAILQSGVKKIKRQDKLLVDKVSATILLQSYLSIYKNT
ncbi:MAG: Holliday junction resolvase RuvX [Flavobacteriaceae bacterium]|nr:Holliday junction resolvase RuvX [Flavobacteriaceae bacterium]|tara:strand:+ start:674 stop:1093 length:420 start_codon:yes stop_codon:yes gene_type:complete